MRELIPSIYRPGLFNDKVALVTGGGTGIGKAIAFELASLGCSVVIASRKIEKLQQTAKELCDDLQKNNKLERNPQDLIFPIQCDIRDEKQVESLFEQILSKYNRIDFLINNAGGQFRAPVEDISINGWNAVVRLNLNGTFIVTKQAYTSYMKEHGGSIVNITLVNEQGLPHMSHSGAARAAVTNLSKTLAVEWAPCGIRVNNVAPGIILSSGIENYGSGGAAMFHLAAKKVTAAKRVGTVEEVAAAVLYYLSPAAAYTTGTTIHIDGGWHLLGPLSDVPPHDRNIAYGNLGDSKL